VTSPPTGSREFRDKIVRLADLTVTTNVLDGLMFENCTIIGPGVLVPLRAVTFHECNWGTTDVQALFWVIEPGRTAIAGGIGVQNCLFSSCRFSEVGLAGDERIRDLLRQGTAS
jgi:hypothetical protein